MPLNPGTSPVQRRARCLQEKGKKGELEVATNSGCRVLVQR